MSKPNKISIDDQLKQLEELLAWFDDEQQFNYDQALEKYQQAQQLVAAIRQQLSELKNTLIEL